MKKKIEIIEVGPRDGFQSVKSDCCLISTEEKLTVIDALIDAGVRHMEFTPSWPTPPRSPAHLWPSTPTQTSLPWSPISGAPRMPMPWGCERSAMWSP